MVKRFLREGHGLRWAAVAAWMGLIFLVSGQPRLPVLLQVADFGDVLGHFAAYAVLALLLRWAMVGAGIRHAVIWALVAALLYGISDEFHQSFVPGRHPDLWDVLADGLGAGTALAARFPWRLLTARRRPERRELNTSVGHLSAGASRPAPRPHSGEP